jgi:hypothetical protein
MAMTRIAPLLAAACLVLAGCGDHIRPPSPEELARFRAAGKSGPAVDMNRVLQAKVTPGPYRVVPGDVLRVEMPRFPDQQPGELAGVDVHQVYSCRVGDNGAIVLPIIGPLAARGMSLAEVEAAIVAQYHPRYVASWLPVYVSVQEYQTQRVSVVGAVTQPGIHGLRHDQMTLVAALQQAGGITIPGAAVIRINRTQAPGPGPRLQPVRDRERRSGIRGGLGYSDSQDSEVPSFQHSDAPAFQPSHPRPILQAIFEQEGPLRSTGWLRVEQTNGEVSVL